MSYTHLQFESARKAPDWKDLEIGDSLPLQMNSSESGSVHAQLLQVHNACQFPITPRLEDLLRIATFCLEADKLIRRGTENDVSLTAWERNLLVSAQVCDADFWNADITRRLLGSYLGYLTGDRWDFFFEGGRTPASPDTLFPGWNLPREHSFSSVMLLSGGQDSLSCLIKELVAGRVPLSCSHTPTAFVDSKQTRLLRELGYKYTQAALPHIAYNSHTISNPGKEGSQRTRGFLYASLGLVVAAGNELDRILLSDNGIMSLNLPALAQSIAARNSRATHPVSLHRFQELACHLTERPIAVENPLKFTTRADVIKTIDESGHRDLIELTRSCARQRAMTQSQPHCGTCSQCVDRRFGAEIAGSDVELPERYLKDIFSSALPRYEDRMQALSYVEWAQEMNGLDESGLFVKHPELADALSLPGVNPQVAGPKYVELIRRHSAGVVDIMNRKIAEAQLASSNLPDECLLRLVASGQRVDKRAEFIDEIRKLLANALIKLPNWKQLSNEDELQLSMDALLSTSEFTDLNREVPLLPYAGISTKPDFSSGSHKDWLFIEAKLVKERKRVNSVVTEITSRITIYRDQGAHVLFLIADPNSTIPDPNKFKRQIGAHKGCWVEITR